MTDIAEHTSATGTAIATTTTAQDSEFTRANIDSIGPQVRLVDSNEELSLYCYVNCGPEDSDLLKQCRGVVFDGDKIVMRGFSYTTEINHEETESIEAAIPNIKNCVCYESHEGVLIRVFCHKSKWYISTHRRLDAFRSKWASKESFGHSFKLALDSEYETNKEFKDMLGEASDTGVMEKLFNTLNTDRQYMFLVRNSEENRIVCVAPETPTLYHVGTFVDGSLEANHKLSELKMKTPSMVSFSSVLQLQDYVYKCDPTKLQGLLVFEGNKVLCKVINSEYQTLFSVRGNEPSRKYRYLQVRTDRKANNAIRSLYPESVAVFEEYEDSIYEVAQAIHDAYVKRFIRKQFVTVPHEEFAVIKECHAWYESNRKSNKVSLTKVVEVLNTQSATKINHMIRHIAVEKIKSVNDIPSAPQAISPLLLNSMRSS
jgi:hypothetical protein